MISQSYETFWRQCGKNEGIHYLIFLQATFEFWYSHSQLTSAWSRYQAPLVHKSHREESPKQVGSSPKSWGPLRKRKKKSNKNDSPYCTMLTSKCRPQEAALSETMAGALASGAWCDVIGAFPSYLRAVWGSERSATTDRHSILRMVVAGFAPAKGVTIGNTEGSVV